MSSRYARGAVVRPLLALALSSATVWAQDPKPAANPGIRPADAQGRPLNLDFETGTLRDWTATGNAFTGQPVEGDLIAARRSDMKSNHQGKYWVGTFEREGDPPRGTLTSVPFQVTQPWASFLVARGSTPESRVEIVSVETGKPIASVTGEVNETLARVAVDLQAHQGKAIVIRLVDEGTGGWGHVNFDDFRFHAARPDAPERKAPPAPDVYAHAGLSPEDAAKAMTVPPGFSVSLFAGEPDVVQPIAMTIDPRGRLWVAEAYSYPTKVSADQAKDRILIFEDANNDGKYDKRTVFADKLNLVSGLEVGFGGVWVGAAPELLFIPDKDGDDRPDGPPQTLLDGWAMQDTHETLNSFVWGPDGWLYGCHGVFTHSRVGKPGTPDAQREPINAGIWRYHPTKHTFEVFSHGTSNPWGVDFNPLGQCFIEACVIPHLYHMIQGGRYERQAGSHFNTNTYDDIKTIADHRHYVGANPHGGNSRSDSAGGGHAHAGLMIYNGGRWPAEYRGSLFMNNIHGARLNRDVVTPAGSGFVGSHRADFLLSNDVWSQVVYIRSGPDGDAFMIDWYDKNQCHRNETEMHDRTNGRIFKIRYNDSKVAAHLPAPSTDLAKATDEQLVNLIVQAVANPDGTWVAPNDWHSRTARRVLQERGLSPALRKALVQTLATVRPLAPLMGANGDVPLDEPRLLNVLWTLHVAGGLDDAAIRVGLDSKSPYVRAWTVQLACEDRAPSSATLARMAELARSDDSPVVRLYLASAAQRLPASANAAKWPILEGLSSHAEDATDVNLPLMNWYALEPLAAADPQRALALAGAAKLPNLLPFTTRRIAALGTPEALASIVGALRDATTPEARKAILAGLDEALQGRRRVDMPAGWTEAFAMLSKDSDEAIRLRAVAIGATFGDEQALGVLRSVLSDADRPAPRRQEALAALLKARDAKLPPVLHRLVVARALRTQAIRALAAFDDPETAKVLLGQYADLAPAERRDALSTLAARPVTALALLDAVAGKTVAANELTADLVNGIRNLNDAKVNARLAEVWGTARATSADKAKLIEKYRGVIRKGYQTPPDLALGRAVYARTCGQCHTLFGTGGDVGPDLTGSNRADLDYVLTNVMDPSALVGKDYQATVVALSDGRTLTGIVRSEDENAITLRTANETLVVPKPDVDERKLTEQSLMPEDQWSNLSDFEIRSLVAYLAAPGQVALLATPENVSSFFNGRDLTGWKGNPELWTVQDGEIIGRTGGLKNNEFLRSELAAGDFRLTLEVKLLKNEGNSGIQFRSEPLPDGEMKGYQADIGPGWWGKLYEESGRALLWDKSGEAHVKNGEWNTYVVEAIGDQIRTSINGKPCVDLKDPAGAKRGIFALQLHSGGATEVRFRNLKLELNPSAQ